MLVDSWPGLATSSLQQNLGKKPDLNEAPNARINDENGAGTPYFLSDTGCFAYLQRIRFQPV
jgi:hypothetical protein